ncbi:uncharacterized protein LOC120083890 isoform X2 [Benincasa hispida]|nr:uncharacterized protein LOC120083890 isoform X2 [Benincasa hispida]
MQTALTPSLKALVSDQLLKHSDIDVKISVAACISEITRITAPNAPYSEEQMKEVFHLIVSSFENLSDKSSRSYAKRASILETVAKVRSCVVMLDLECDALIIEMFQHFLKTVAESMSVRMSEDEVEEKPTEEATPERVDATIEKHHNLVKSNGVTSGGEDGSISTLENKKEEHGGQQCKEVKSPKSPEPANLGYEKASNVKERAAETESDTTSDFEALI